MLARVRDLCLEAGACYEAGRTELGLKLAFEAMELCRETLGEEHYAYVHCLTTMGWLEAQAESDGAAGRFDEAWDRAEALAATDFDMAAVAMEQILLYLEESGRKADHEAKGRRLVALYEQHVGPMHPRTCLVRDAVSGT